MLKLWSIFFLLQQFDFFYVFYMGPFSKFLNITNLLFWYLSYPFLPGQWALVLPNIFSFVPWPSMSVRAS